MMMVMFVTYYKPFTEPVFNKIEVFNEVCILLASYHLLLYNDFVPSTDDQYMAGWSIALVTAINMLVNLVVILVMSLRLLKL